MRFRTGGEQILCRAMSCEDLIEKTKKHLRSVLISEKGGVALDRLEKDYKDLVNILGGYFDTHEVC